VRYAPERSSVPPRGGFTPEFIDNTVSPAFASSTTSKRVIISGRGGPYDLTQSELHHEKRADEVEQRLHWGAALRQPNVNLRSAQLLTLRTLTEESGDQMMFRLLRRFVASAVFVLATALSQPEAHQTPGLSGLLDCKRTRSSLIGGINSCIP